MTRLQALTLLLSTTSLTLSLAAHPTRDAICTMFQIRCKPTIGEGSGKNDGMRHRAKADVVDQQSPWTEVEDKEDNPPSASSDKHNHAVRDKRSRVKEWKFCSSYFGTFNFRLVLFPIKLGHLTTLRILLTALPPFFNSIVQYFFQQIL